MFLPMVSLVASLFIKTYLKTNWLQFAVVAVTVTNPMILMFSGLSLNDLAMTFFLSYSAYLFVGAFNVGATTVQRSALFLSIVILFFALTIKDNYAVVMSFAAMALLYVARYQRSLRNGLILLFIFAPVIAYEVLIDLPYVTAVWFSRDQQAIEATRGLVFVSPLEALVSLFAKSSFDQSTIIDHSPTTLLRYFYRLLSPEMLGLGISGALILSTYVFFRRRIDSASRQLILFTGLNLVIIYLFLISNSLLQDTTRYSLYLFPLMIPIGIISLKVLGEKPEPRLVLLLGGALIFFILLSLYLDGQGVMRLGYQLPDQRGTYFMLIPQALAIIGSMIFAFHIFRSKQSAVPSKKASERVPMQAFPIIVVVIASIVANGYMGLTAVSESPLFDNHGFDLMSKKIDENAGDNIVLTNAFIHLRPYLSSSDKDVLPLPMNGDELITSTRSLPNGSIFLFVNDDRIYYEYANAYAKQYVTKYGLPYLPIDIEAIPKENMILAIDKNTMPESDFLDETGSIVLTGEREIVGAHGISFGNVYTVDMAFKLTSQDYGEFGRALVMKRYNEHAEFFSYVDSDGRLIAFAKNDNNTKRYNLQTDPGTVVLDKWYRVTVSVGEDAASLSINGTAMATSAVNGNNENFQNNPRLSEEPLRIGIDGTGGFDRNFVGVMKYVHIYNSVPIHSALLDNFDLPHGEAKIFQVLHDENKSDESHAIAVKNVFVASNSTHSSLNLQVESEGRRHLTVMLSTIRFSKILDAEVSTGTNKIKWDFEDYLDNRQSYGTYLNYPIKVMAWTDSGDIVYRDTIAPFKITDQAYLYWAIIPLGILSSIILLTKKNVALLKARHPTNILVILPAFFGWTGNAVNERQLVLSLAKRVGKVYLITLIGVKQIFTKNRKETEIDLPNNIVVIRIPFIWHTSKTVLAIQMLIYSFFLAPIALLITLFNRLDGLYVRDIYLAYFIVVIKSLSRRTIVKIAALWNEEQGASSKLLTMIGSRVQKAVMHRSAKIAVHTDTFSEILNGMGVNARKIFIIPPGIDKEKLGQITKTSKPETEIRIGFVGYVSQWQGVDILVNAVKILATDYHNIHVYVVGDGPELDSVKKLAKDLHVAATFTGKRGHDDALSLMASCDVLAIPRRRTHTTEAVFPIKMLEAMALEVPVIITGHNVLKFLKDRSDVLFCEPDPADLAEKIRLILSDRSLADSMRTRGKELSNSFDYGNISEALLRGLHEID
jgi:glycosyltransferase involved in cell wall biosynthesis